MEWRAPWTRHRIALHFAKHSRIHVRWRWNKHVARIRWRESTTTVRILVHIRLSVGRHGREARRKNVTEWRQVIWHHSRCRRHFITNIIWPWFHPARLFNVSVSRRERTLYRRANLLTRFRAPKIQRRNSRNNVRGGGNRLRDPMVAS